ncbi:MAG: hypothetical protein ACYDCK_11985 [Thermoplasmatota archaeon]
MALSPRLIETRLRLAHYLNRECNKGLTDALALTGFPPISTAENERIWRDVERAVWDLPDAWFEAGNEASIEDLAAREPVRRALEDIVTRLLEARTEDAKLT